MFKLMGLEINTILGAQMIIIWTYVKWALSWENPDFGLSDQVMLLQACSATETS